MARRTHEFQLGAQNASSSGLIHYLCIEYRKEATFAQSSRPQIYSPLRMCVV